MKETKITSITIPEERIMSKIYIIRGQKVMLDRDLAELYGIQTKVLNQSVRRNFHRFPHDFMFELTKGEVTFLRSQIVTSKRNRGGRRYLPYVFTEHGILMLSSVLNSEIAINTNILIIRVFIKLKEMIIRDAELRVEIQRVENKFDKKVGAITEVVKKLVERDDRNAETKIGFGKE